MSTVALFGSSLGAFLAIMNPLANAPVFIGLVDGLDRSTARAVAIRAVALAFAITVAFAALGATLLSVFGISFAAFRIAGGLVVAKVGFDFLHGGGGSRMHATDASDVQASRDAALSIAVSPLAMPLLAGPGTLVTAMNATAHRDLAGWIVVLAAFATVCLATLASFLLGERLVRVLGASFLAVVSRLMGLILAGIGAQMVIDGIRGAWPGG